MAKNPSMPKSEAFAIATQQSHALGKSPKGYGTSEGRKAAKQKYDEPKSHYTQTADPKEKTAFSINSAVMSGFCDEFQKIAGLEMKPTAPEALGAPKMTAPKVSTSTSTKAPVGPAKVNSEPVRPPSMQHQPVLEPPAVRR